jgi:uncharacterized damage-inducible protein DinB
LGLKEEFKMEENLEIRKRLSEHLKGGEAFLPLEEMLNKMEFEKLGVRPQNLPYSFYELFYHIRFAQKDILDYCNGENYKSHIWPDDYWPGQQAPESREDWDKLKNAYFGERQKLSDFLLSPDNDLLSPVKEGTNHTLLREVMLVIEHSAYHNGQLLILLRQLGLYS